MINEYFSLAISDLRHRSIRSFLTLLGIVIGIAAVVSLISLGNGLEKAITGQFGGLSIDILTVQNKQAGFAPPGSGVTEKLNQHDIDLIQDINGVEKVVTRLIRVTRLEYNDALRFSYVADLPQDEEGTEIVYKAFDAKISKGRLLKPEDRGKIILGADFDNEKIFGKKINIGNKININGKDFEIVGILKPTSTFVINGAVLMPNEDLKEVLQIGDEVDLIVVRTRGSVEDTAKEIERVLRKDRDEDLGEESFVVETPIQSVESVNNILNVINIVVIGIAAISLFVGGIGIANTMYTSILEKTRDIGIMKAVGARNKDILTIFLIESGLLGLVGGFIGAIIGLLAAYSASSIANNALGIDLLSVEISYPLLIGAISFSFLIGVIFGIIPAIQGSKLKIVDALRK